jgi:hypothetical protein
MDRETSEQERALDDSVGRALIGVPVVADIRRLIVIALVAAVVYSIALTASRGYCTGSMTNDGAFVDDVGRDIGTVPLCLNMTLSPSPVVYAALVIVVLVALGRIVSRAADLADAARILNRAGMVIGALVTAAVVIAHLWFWLLPFGGWQAGGGLSFLSPILVGIVEVESSPLVQFVP